MAKNDREHKEILIKLDKLVDQTGTIKVDMARTNEHLKNLNGSVQRHEKSIADNDDKIDSLNISMGKIYTGAAIIGSIAGSIFAYVVSVLKGWLG